MEDQNRMASSRKSSKRSPTPIGSDIKTELRNILHNYCELVRPIDRFHTLPDRPVGRPRYFVCFDGAPHHAPHGLQIQSHEIRLPVESFLDRAALLAASVWHLKDRLNHYAKTTRVPVDPDAWAHANVYLRICGDIGNLKKHGHHQNFSGINPRLVSDITFDTSRSGKLELCYDGATKSRELLVSETVPIPFRVDLVDGSGNFLGTATDVIRTAFDHWLPLIWQLRLVASDDREDIALREVLFPGQVVLPVE